MAFSASSSSLFTTTCIILFLISFTTPVSAFGSGKIAAVSTIAGKNWRHGDIEDTLLELFITTAGRTKFDLLAVKRVYFGNWLRDYSQAVDVGGLKMVPKDTIRLMLWILSFVTFGFATAEFEVTEERLGCYRPEEHIDNPKDYADNEDARKYDSRLRGPVDEGHELKIDEDNGMKAYIASESHGIETSASFVRSCFTRSIELGRAYGRDGRDTDLYEALRMLGTGLHTLEDFSAHSNYIELVLNELGENVFPHVGVNTRVSMNGKDIWPVVTGTFGMTDFLHSVVGEMNDKMMQSEVQELEGKLQDAQRKNKGGTTSTLKTILDNIPFSLLGLGDNDFAGQAEKIQQDADAKEMEQKANISEGSKATEDIKRQAQQTLKEIYPILEFHDKVMKAIAEGIDKIPGATELLENLTGAMQIYIFSMLAPYLMPILERLKTELAAGSAGILESSEKGQYVVFNDDISSNPTHSMLSKDHFTNILNDCAGRVASEVVRIVVPMITAAWDDAGKDVNEVCNEAISILHHPALRSGEVQDRMFRVVEEWWNNKSDREKDHYRDALSKEGVKEGRNHEGDDEIGGPGSKNHSHGSCGYGGHRKRQERTQESSGRRGESYSSHGQSQRESEGRREREKEQERQKREQQAGAKTLDKVVPGFIGGLLKTALGVGGNESKDEDQPRSRVAGGLFPRSDQQDDRNSDTRNESYSSSWAEASLNQYNNKEDAYNSRSSEYKSSGNTYSRRNDNEDAGSYGRREDNYNSSNRQFETSATIQLL